jgi:truncated hemoglobin YjbI
MNKEEIISKTVHEFYAKAKSDFMIGYHFRVIDDFDSHIPRIITFWEIQLLNKKPSTKIEPFDLINIHRPLGIKKGELGRWVTLFDETLNEICKDESLKIEWQDKVNFFQERMLKTFF